MENGITLVCRENNSANLEVSVTFKCGHINEPMLGIAAVYENVVHQASNNKVMSVYGGSMTSFVTTVAKEQLGCRLDELFSWCCGSVTEERVTKAIADIVQHTKDLAPLPLRQAKLAYKHTAYGNNQVVWDTEDYIAKVSQITAKDVENYINDSFHGKNIVIAVSGASKILPTVQEAVMGSWFALSLEEGKRQRLNNMLYTGGYQEIEGNGTTQIAMFGWDISDGEYLAETNVLMSMLSGRLERSLAGLGIPATYEIKVAGYFGLRSLRITVSCPTKSNFQKCIDVVAENVHRLRTSLASDRRLETSRQRAMAERLAISNEALPRSVKEAWSILRRSIDYDNDSAINGIWQVSAEDVRSAADIIFGRDITCVLYTNAKHESYESIVAKMA